ncbi:MULTISPECIES: phage tail sheath subtilisin-like domain-containing protein [Pseudoalteromonas]|uniref:Phage tail protein n=1 Tax=Pseudoalteromonas maricaloris TaxID=184924 RepID=A0A8I2H2U3_9GAMM|nr:MULTISPECIES: phage tail sheath subtilisin-like domain-containing protein [Pseudoalteromonas]NLR20792.1 phage tail protein [Pseudoalteromonas maricaloris]RZG14922.1 phage tail protein [Pseudoalteromonas sp. CO342X]WOX29724.1 phage tail sheath subtilisin-like domain-containing protein [Pseudoalteromonas maricaloris]
MSKFLHGVEVIEAQSGTRPIKTVKSSVIGVIGTAPSADPEKFPLNTPVLVAGKRAEAAPLGTEGTLPAAMDGIFDQAGAVVVVVRVDGADEAAIMSNMVGGVAADGSYEGVQAFLGAESVLGVTPRIFVAPGYAHQRPEGNRNPVITELVNVAERLRAVIIADGPNTNDEDAKTYRADFGSRRVFVVDPHVKVFRDGKTEVEPASARVAGMIAKSDNDRGFWWSPSNTNMNGIVATARPIDFQLGDANARANMLNEKEVSTIIRQNGFKLWGNRTCSDDPKWAFLSVVRTADMINDSLLRAHMWAVDRNITKTYIEDVTQSVQSYLDSLKAQGAILGGQIWADEELNTPANIQAGKVYFSFDFTPPTPAEHITFKSILTNNYLEEIV